MSPDVINLDLEEVSDILFLHLPHVSFLLDTGQDGLEEEKLRRCTYNLMYYCLDRLGYCPLWSFNVLLLLLSC